MILIICDRATPEQMQEMLEILGIYIKLAVDIQQGILAGGGELHSDCSFRKCAMAVNLDITKTQYSQHDTSTQLGKLSANLIQIKALVQAGTEEQLVQDLIRESQFFIEWAVPSLNLETEINLATELAELQRQLSRWKLHWPTLWTNASDRSQIAKHAQEWSDRLLNLSGLLAS